MKSLSPVVVLATLFVSSAALAHGDADDHEHHSIADAATSAALANRVKITERDGVRIIESNGIPDHKTGAFPNRGNPNRISEQRYEYRVTMKPKANDEATPARGKFGVGLNGVPFDPGTAEFWTPGGRRMHAGGDWNYDALSGKIDLGVDGSNAHVQPTGAYHYHGLPTGLIAERGKPNTMVMVGYAADGFPIYNQYGYKDKDDPTSGFKKMKSSWRLKKGARPGGNDGPGGRYDGTFTADFEYVQDAGDLDECNGRFGPTPEHPEGIYHYHITESYPFIPRHWRGDADESFKRRGPGNRPGGRDGDREGREGRDRDDRRPPPPPGRRPPFGPPPR